MGFGSRLSIIADCYRDKMKLDVGIFDPGLGAHKPRTLKMIGRTVSGFEKQPLCSDHCLGKQVQFRIQGDGLQALLLDI